MWRLATLCAFIFAAMTVPARPALASAAPRPGTTFRDCADCPEMTVIPPGKFMMGSPPGEAQPDAADEGPQHLVTIAYPLAVGKYEVTRGEWAEFVKASGLRDPEYGCNRHMPKAPFWPQTAGLSWRNTGYPQTDRHPAVCLSWEEAQQYIAWLSNKTGKTYRMLSESEWEYAARAGTKTAHLWGEKPQDACRYANGSDLTRKEAHPEWNADQPCHDGYAETSPAGSFRPNRFGLYDMAGNVAEMTLDCLHPDYKGAPRDGSPWLTGDCKNRMNRGDTWTSMPGGMRSAARSYDNARYTRVYDLGFRVARRF
jgi:formylglycine-generating enzyme required for sulfatase activity